MYIWGCCCLLMLYAFVMTFVFIMCGWGWRNGKVQRNISQAYIEIRMNTVLVPHTNRRNKG